MHFDNFGEEMFYEFLVNFELTSMVKFIESQVWITTTPTQRRRIDLVLTLVNNQKIYLELDGSGHETPEVQRNDRQKEAELKAMGIEITRITFKDFFKDKLTVANKLEGLIDVLTGDI